MSASSANIGLPQFAKNKKTKIIEITTYNIHDEREGDYRVSHRRTVCITQSEIEETPR